MAHLSRPRAVQSGGFVLLQPPAWQVLQAVIFQYNPDALRRRIAVVAVPNSRGGGARVDQQLWSSGWIGELLGSFTNWWRLGRPATRLRHASRTEARERIEMESSSAPRTTSSTRTSTRRRPGSVSSRASTRSGPSPSRPRRRVRARYCSPLWCPPGPARSRFDAGDRRGGLQSHPVPAAGAGASRARGALAARAARRGPPNLAVQEALRSITAASGSG